MPTKKYFEKCPPFPEDALTAELPTLSLARLRANEDNESRRLFAACRQHGFFMLDLSNSAQGLQFQQDGEAMFDLAADLFSLPSETFEPFMSDPPRRLIGYKKPGNMRVEDGKVDATEMYMISQDDMLGNIEPLDNPQPVEERRDACRKFIQHAHGITTVILDHLDRHLDLSPGTLADRSRLDRPSGTTMRLLRTNVMSPEEEEKENQQQQQRITLGGHTDVGTVTVLFHVAGGLQILPAGAENVAGNWRFVRPVPGCALVNMGDTMVQWTGGVLRSSVHRVVTAPGDQARLPRQSLAYLVRPDDTQSMARMTGGKVIPPLKPGEEPEKLPINEWALERATRITTGEIKVESSGGIPIATV